jgi:hypothetical protein
VENEADTEGRLAKRQRSAVGMKVESFGGRKKTRRPKPPRCIELRPPDRFTLTNVLVALLAEIKT